MIQNPTYGWQGKPLKLQFDLEESEGRFPHQASIAQSGTENILLITGTRLDEIFQFTNAHIQ